MYQRVENTLYTLQYHCVNTAFFFSKRIQSSQHLKIYQKLYLTGKGRIDIGTQVSFGFKLGGYWRTSGIQEDSMIGNTVWLGNNCMILRGSIIGENSIVAAGSIVKGKFPKNVIIGGVPAKIIKEITIT